MHEAIAGRVGIDARYSSCPWNMTPYSFHRSKIYPARIKAIDLIPALKSSKTYYT